MKYLIIIFTGLLFGNVQLIEKKEARIYWSANRKLKYSDFKAKPYAKVKFQKAYTVSGITANSKYRTGEIPEIEISAYFLPNKSWMIKKDSLVLRHEQVHFDISEVYARKIRKAYDSLAQKNITDIKIYTDLFKKYNEQNRQYNDSYDTAVYTVYQDHVDYRYNIQEEWIKKIKQELAYLEDYSIHKK